MARTYKSNYKDKIQYHTEQAEKFEKKAIEALKKGDAVFYEDYCSRKEQSLESISFFINKQAELEKESEPYSTKWGRINWYRQANVIPCVFSNPRIDEEPYNARLNGPRIMTGWLRDTQLGGVQNAPCYFNIRSGSIDYKVNPMTDANFRMASYKEIEESEDLVLTNK
jgi:hypothetical protein